MTSRCLFNEVVFNTLERVAIIRNVKTGFNSIVFLWRMLSWRNCVFLYLIYGALTSLVELLKNIIEISSTFVWAKWSVSHINLYSYLFIHLIEFSMRTSLMIVHLVLVMLLDHGSCIVLSTLTTSDWSTHIILFYLSASMVSFTLTWILECGKLFILVQATHHVCSIGTSRSYISFTRLSPWS